MATQARAVSDDLTFWQKLIVGLAIFIIFGFAQFSARGFVDIRAVPFYIHLHAVVMLAWLSLTAVQATLIARDNRALHRRLGWIGAALAVLVVVLGSFVAIKTVDAGRVPPFFTPPYFLALTQVGLIAFAGLVVAAILRRRETEWHRRLMVGALVLLLEPALGRVLPMPLIQPWGEWMVLACQLGVLAIVIRHDRRTLGTIHPATTSAVVVTALSHCIVEIAGISPPFIAWADHLAGV